MLPHKTDDRPGLSTLRIPTEHGLESQRAADCAEHAECAQRRHHYAHGTVSAKARLEEPMALIEHAMSLRREPGRRQRAGSTEAASSRGTLTRRTRAPSL
jgi:hypothetical protein